MSAIIRFSPGDRFVLLQHGVVEVLRIAPRSVGGPDGVPEAVVELRVLWNGMPYALPAHDPDPADRPLVSRAKAEDMVASLQGPASPHEVSDAALAGLLAVGRRSDPDEMLGAFRQLLALSRTGSLPFAEGKFMHMFRERLAWELSTVLGSSPESVRAALDAAQEGGHEPPP